MKTYTKIKNGFKITVKPFSNEVIVSKDGKIIDTQKFKDAVQALLVAKSL